MTPAKGSKGKEAESKPEKVIDRVPEQARTEDMVEALGDLKATD